MNSAALVRILLLVVLAIAGSACQIVGDIFQAGMWVGIIAVVMIAVLVFYVVSKLRT